jgi:hypothetical protein
MVCKLVETSDDSPCEKPYVMSNEPTINAIVHLKNRHNIFVNGYGNVSKELGHISKKKL